ESQHARDPTQAQAVTKAERLTGAPRIEIHSEEAGRQPPDQETQVDERHPAQHGSETSHGKTDSHGYRIAKVKRSFCDREDHPGPRSLSRASTVHLTFELSRRRHELRLSALVTKARIRWQRGAAGTY